MQIKENTYLDFSDVLILPDRSKINSRKEVVLERILKCNRSNISWTGIPIIAANMDTIATFEIAEVMSKNNMLTAIHKHYSLEEWKSFLNEAEDKLIEDIFVSTGTSPADLEKLDAILTYQPKLNKICLDVANGYTNRFLESCKTIVEKYPGHMIMAGNVITENITEELALLGISIIKVGIGPGSMCLTREMTGVGMPQLSCVIENANSAHGLDSMICSDGGCTNPGDISKAFAAGADFVMLGGMLGGHTENPGEVIIKDGKYYKVSYGMSSKKANEKYAGGIQGYKASEGKEVLIELKGNLQDTLTEIVGGIRSTCSYVGALRLKDLTKRTTFIKVNNQINESLGES